jgi:ABC-type antimicrobial peptide transport system permease subunit
MSRSKTALIAIAILAAASIIVASIISYSHRFATSNAGDGRVYKVDRRTGQVVLLAGTKELPVNPVETPKQTSPSDSAIALAKSANTLSFASRSFTLPSNEAVIAREVRSMTGDLHILGWKANKINEQTYLVTYSVEQGLEIHTWTFEVNLVVDLVRDVSQDSTLAKKYSLRK